MNEYPEVPVMNEYPEVPVNIQHILFFYLTPPPHPPIRSPDIKMSSFQWPVTGKSYSMTISAILLSVDISPASQRMHDHSVD